MATNDALKNILSRLTPERLQEIVLSLADARTKGDRTGIPVLDVVEALSGGAIPGEGAEGWQVYLALVQAIRETIEAVPGMRYIPGDA
jgi:hypothetical protein